MWKSYHLLEMGVFEREYLDFTLYLMCLVVNYIFFHFLHALKSWHVSFLFPYLFPKMMRKEEEKSDQNEITKWFGLDRT